MLDRIVLQAEKECYAPNEERQVFKHTYDAVEMVRPLAKTHDGPSCWAMALSKGGKIIAIDRVPNGYREGLPNGSRLFAKFGLLADAERLLVFHTHASGNSEPTQWDHFLTTCLQKSLDSVGIKLEDHVVIGRKDYFSYADHRLLTGSKGG